MKKRQALLLYADSESSADMLYFTDFFAPDPFFAFYYQDRKIGVFNALEFDRAVRESSLHEVWSWEELVQEGRALAGGKKHSVLARVAWAAGQRLGATSWLVAGDLPTQLYLDLEALGGKLAVVDSPFAQQRAIKSREQADRIREGNRASEAGFNVARQHLAKAEIRGNTLWLGGKRLTSERLRMAIDIACLQRGAVANHTIVAGGDQACDPHCRGEGPLRAHELIIVDIFPRVSRHGYHGDMTRTFLKGEASDEQRRLVRTVRRGQQMGVAAVADGVAADGIHAAITEYFTQEGYATGKTEAGYHGFFHGTGHGLGLQVHESPRVSQRGDVLRTGHVVTVEPGLYYKGLGACRIEDVVWVQPGGCQLLSSYAYANWVVR